jgi:hypothetical protein
MVEYRRRLVDYYESTAVSEVSGGVKPTRRRSVAADTREGMVDEGTPFRSL